MAESLIDRIVRKQVWLEGPADTLQKGVGATYAGLGSAGRGLKNVLHGTWLLGHPFHPAISDIPIGAWTVGVIADLVALSTTSMPRAAGDLALAIGILGALLAALSGLTDYADTFGHERRMAVSHGLLMSLALVIDIISMALRLWASSGAHGLAVVLAIIGWLVALGAAYLGGHLVFGIGTQVNRLAFAEGPDEFVDVGSSSDFAEGDKRLVEAGPMPVLLVRLGGVLRAIPNTCVHAGGPLNEGELSGTRITCPWHGSTFDLRDGSVHNGPATFSQPSMVVREQNGRVEVKLAAPLH
jgi:nitrite reductase/ring-hydroxylating ferredoxin subunit/uncharacterized membrane protein